ncbi:hypothetical protein D4764_15G0009390 [Takifugu flavidus]|uniref:Uncharacterized protein n=1 Tax=Takifugu flavidus TaxID=433684 RepID=A0A5C6P2L3_9TELE|nr:hypothetical protein D4764_15G0009390 [Takifugu flavidus]
MEACQVKPQVKKKGQLPKPPPKPVKEKLSVMSELSTSKDSLSGHNQLHRQLSPDSKMGEMESEEEKLSVKSELSTSKDSLSEHNQDKVGLFGRMFRKSPKPPENNQTNEDQRSLHDNMSGSSDSLSENSKERVAIFLTYCRSKITGKNIVPSHITNMDEIPLIFDIPLTHTVEKKGTSMVVIRKMGHEKSSFTVVLGCHGNGQKLPSMEKGGSLFSGLLKKTPKPSEKTSDFANREALRELSASNEDLTASEDDLSEKSNTKDKNFLATFLRNHRKKHWILQQGR